MEASTHMTPEEMKNDLFQKAMKGKWDTVVEIYRQNPEAHMVRSTRSGDTVLHMAVSDGKEEIVEELIHILSSNGEEGKTALKIGNDTGNTPLHVAASTGNVGMCQCIAQVDASLVGARNEDNETPFFLAAAHGKKDAFLCLLRICGREKGFGYSRRKNGETILHVAIAGDYFDLAFQIIQLYNNDKEPKLDLVNSFDEEGFSPLHLLAGKPSAFRSSSHQGRYYKIIYHWIWVDKLQVDPIIEKVVAIDGVTDTNSVDTSTASKENRKGRPKYPKNYKTCVSLIQLFWNVVRHVIIKGKNGANSDPESDLGSEVTNGARGDPDQPFPSNYVTCFEFVKLANRAVLVLLGLGYTEIGKIHAEKEKHIWSFQIMNELLDRTSMNENGYTGTNPSPSEMSLGGAGPSEMSLGGDGGVFKEILLDKQRKSNSLTSPKPSELPNPSNESEGKNTGGEGGDEHHEKAKNETTILIAAKNGVSKISESIKEYFPVAIRDMNLDSKNIMLLTLENKSPHDLLMGKAVQKGETPLLIAAKNGITEIVEKILELFPSAIHDMNSEKKNIVLLAVEHRQPHVYQLLLGNENIHRDNVFGVVDNEGNSALHLAAKLGDYKPWLIPGAALQMQWEIKWYEFVKESMDTPNFFPSYNKERKTPKDLFTETHRDLIEKGGEWLNKTSESCSVVAALIATVAFATSSTVPGGVKSDSGTPTLEKHPPFNVFAISSLIALCFSVTAVIMFLSILTSRFQERDFGRDLPTKLLVGLTSLFVSIASMLISFCAGHFFVLRDELKYAAFPVYALTCLPVTFFAMVQFPLYFDLIWATFKKIPQRSYNAVPL